ncbi:MAG TPA: hypothetical protein VFE50_12025 [Cyclobacteriaceae bacterium]|nr:hypothetical protein [Cyclobacteriaceae bacterium]
MTDSMLRWDPLFAVLPSIIVSLIALSVLIALELRRKQKFLILRIAAQCILVTSILLLAMRPSIATDERSRSVLLLTDGYNDSTVDSLKAAYPSLQVRQLESFNDLSDLDVRVITGNGLPAWAIDLLPEKNFTFVASKQPEGISGIEIPGHIYAHRVNEIRGTYHMTGQSAAIKLRGPGGAEDSVTLKGPGDAEFSLKYFAKAPGRFNYELVTPGGTEALPLVIEPERTFNILFIADYPTFETRYLKNFLASKGHRLSVRNQVSRGRYKLEFANRPPSNFQTLSTTVLKEADLLVIDEPSWHTLSAAEQKNLRNAVLDGLGVVILPEARPAKQKGLIQFVPTNQKDTARVGLSVLPALPLEVKQSTSVLASNDRVLSGYIFSGAGKTGYQLLHETYQLGLQGKAEEYASLWVPLLEKCARSEQTDFKVKITSPFPYYENQPIEFDVLSSGKQPHIRSNNIELPLAEDTYIDDLWHGKVWLEGNTWHDLTIDSASTWVYVSQGWKTLNAINNRKATSKIVEASSTAPSHVVYEAKNILLFIAFLLAAGFLWLAPKL